MAVNIFPYAFAPYCAVLKADAKPSLLSRLTHLISEIRTDRGTDAADVQGDER